MKLFCPKCGAEIAELPPTGDDEVVESTQSIELREASRFSADWKESINPKLQFFGLARCIFCRCHFTIAVPRLYIDQVEGQSL